MQRFPLLVAASTLALLLPVAVTAQSAPGPNAPAPPTAPAPAAAAAATTTTPAAPPEHYGTFGVDLAARDLAVKPGDDFQRYATGKWLDTHPIPADRPSVSVGYDVYQRTQGDLRQLIIDAPAGSGYGVAYNSFMDEAKVEATGAAPLKADLARLAAVNTKSDFARTMSASSGAFGASVVDVSVGADTANPNLNVLWLGQGGLGLPDRDYYLTDGFKPQRDAYLAYIGRTFRLLGHPDAAGDAAKVFGFEHAIAGKSWPIADRRDVGRINNPLSSAALAGYAPGIDWNAYYAGAGVGPQGRMIVAENSAVRDIAAIYAATPLTTLKLWEEFRIADQAAPYLSKAWVDNRFAFTSTLSGVSAQLPRWKRGVTLVDDTLGELVGQDYVKDHFSAKAKAEMETLVANLKAAMADRIRANDWMSPSTKQAALDKLSRMMVMVGYPDKFRDYAGLRLVPGDLYGNVARTTKFNFAYQLADLGKPVDRRKWAMSPQTVNAYNGGLENKIVFPAGILQPPFFDPAADDAVNYGATGAIIGHGISHGFDDQGRKIDATGAVRDWWAPGDAARFEARAKTLGDQYAKYEAVPGVFVNPALTMGENIADYAGLEVALDAYHRSLGGKPAPVIEGTTGDQRFFLAFAQAWRGKARDDALRQQVASDPHSPRRFRTLGPVRNIDAWYAAFDVKPGDAMYLPPEQRARIW